MTIVKDLNELGTRFGAGHLYLSRFPIEDESMIHRQLELLGGHCFRPLEGWPQVTDHG